MSVNCLSSNTSIHEPHHSQIIFNFCVDISSYRTRPCSFIFTIYLAFSISFLFPLSILILYHGLQQWWHKHSTSSAATMSHSDSFTYHLVIMELICNLGCIFSICGIYRDKLILMLVGFCLISFTWFGETFFHILTCVERYLAVVHPITYVSLRNERGIRIRNIGIGCVWLLCFAGISLVMNEDLFIIVDFCLVVLSFIIISFCSLSVLCVLIRPGPGEQGGNRGRVDQSKLRAFYTILAILGALVLRFVGGLFWAVVSTSGGMNNCVINTSSAWFNVPSSLVLPLLFLYREDRFLCCKNNSK